MIGNYERMIKLYNKKVLVLFKYLKQTETAMIRFDDPNFVDDDIRRLEREIED